jgi:hypothetical protein
MRPTVYCPKRRSKVLMYKVEIGYPDKCITGKTGVCKGCPHNYGPYEKGGMKND